MAHYSDGQLRPPTEFMRSQASVCSFLVQLIPSIRSDYKDYISMTFYSKIQTLQPMTDGFPSQKASQAVRLCRIMMSSCKCGKWLYVANNFMVKTSWLKGGVYWESRVKLGMKNILIPHSCWWKYLPQLCYSRFTGVMIHDTNTWHLPICYGNQPLKGVSKCTKTSGHGKAFRITSPLLGETISHWWIPLATSQ